jgi:hypothetical protein
VTATVTDRPQPSAFQAVTADLYRDIHKGIRAEMFRVTQLAGSLDPSDRRARTAFAADVEGLVQVLESHAEHEDNAVQPALQACRPDLAATIAADHIVLDARYHTLREVSAAAVDATADSRVAMHHAYLELASFTSAYLAHQHTEEQIVMPALEAAIGVDAVRTIHGHIVAALPPQEMATTLAFMLPAMNVDDRAELLAGMRANAPAPVFEGVWGLAGSVLAPADYAVLGSRLDIA